MRAVAYTKALPSSDAGCFVDVNDHAQPMTPQLNKIGLRNVEVILGLNASDRHLPEIAERPIDAAHLREAHRRLESGRAYGKIVLAEPPGSSGHFV